MSFSVGSLIKARGREWVVLPDSQEDLLLLRPLGGSDEEITGISPVLEPVEPAQFGLPRADDIGDYRSARLLRDAVRLSSRAGAGPLRSLSRIAFEPRPYQIVPLLMALSMNPVRLLIADDVGIGKTVEAALIARELYDRGEIQRIAVLCPPHLAEQWQSELRDKFHIEAELVLPSTTGRLERHIGPTESIFDRYPNVIVSLDFIKTDRRREEFVRTAPELVIVDEAHTCAFSQEKNGSRHQRHLLVEQLSQNPDRHLILVTATPHSGKEEAFRSLLAFLDPRFKDLPADLTGPERASERRRLAGHFVQRRRADIRHFLQTDTPFPTREESERTYRLTPEYRRLFDRVLAYARESVADNEGGQHRQRVRWWSALALLRSLASSPAAAAETLRTRAATADTETLSEADEIGRRTVFDVDVEDQTEGVDVVPGSDTEEGPDKSKVRHRLLDMAREAEKLKGDKDAKLVEAARQVQGLLDDGFRPIVFCRFIPTAHYVADELRKRLPKDARVEAVTGQLPPGEREARVRELAKSPKRVLVATDCLSEGINLQEMFDAVMHYDLSWSPTRHEQREGRVDRYGQMKSTVRVLTYYSTDNQIDGIVLDVLIRKHKVIRSSLGVSVPVPVDTDAVTEAIFEGLLLRQTRSDGQLVFTEIEEFVRPRKAELHQEWEDAARREKRSRTMFAQESIKPEAVVSVLEQARDAAGFSDDVRRFTLESLEALGAVVTDDGAHVHLDIKEVPRALKDVLGVPDRLDVRFELPVGDKVIYLARTHPLVEGLATYVLDTSLDPLARGIARRAGALRTRAVARRTTLLLVRYRYDIVTRRNATQHSQLAEEVRLLAFEGSPMDAVWLEEQDAQRLLDATPDANVLPEQARQFVNRVLSGIRDLRPYILSDAKRRAGELLAAHQRVREAAHLRGVTYRVEPQGEADILGVYVYLPVGAGGNVQ